MTIDTGTGFLGACHIVDNPTLKTVFEKKIQTHGAAQITITKDV